MSVFEGLLGAGGVAEQMFVWGVMQQVVSDLLQPYFVALQNKVASDHPDVPLSPADAAHAVVRSYMDEGDGQAEAAKAGIDAGRFAVLRDLAGTAPSPQDLVAALRRGIIAREGSGAGSTSFTQGIKETNLLDKWQPVVEALASILLSPADLATAANRSFMDVGEATAEAAQAGIDPARFAILRDLAGDAPSPTQLTEALRRGLIEREGSGAASTSFVQGIAETNLLDKWTGVVEGLAKEWPTPADALRAALQGQVSVEDGKALYERWGGDGQWYQVMYDTEGSAPTPLEAVQMALRGIIGWEGTGPQATTYQQAFLEGPWRNKWEDAYKKAAYYYPTASEAVELYRYAAIDRDQAAGMLARRGVTGADATAFLAYAEVDAITDYRGLTESAILDMVSAGYTSDAQATVMLKALHKGDAAVTQLLSYAHVQRALTQLNRVIQRIGNLYAGRKITRQGAYTALVGLKIPPTEIGPLLEDWDAVNSVNVKLLTESQIADAWEYGIMTQDEAAIELENLGYTPYDAWAVLSVKNKAPLPGKPEKGPAPPQGTVVPGVT